MTKSTITRERLLEIIVTGPEASGAEQNELARMALAAMDGEPVAEVVSIYGDTEAFGEREIRPLVGIQQMPYGTKLYRHAQPAPEEVKGSDELYDVIDDEGDVVLSAISFNEAQTESDGYNGENLHIVRHEAQLAPVVPAIPDEMTSEQAYEIGDYHGDPVDVFARGANWMRQHIIDSTLSAIKKEEKP